MTSAGGRQLVTAGATRAAFTRPFAGRAIDRVATAAGAASLAGVIAVTAAAGETGELSTPYDPPGAWHAALWVGLIGAFAAYALGVALVSRWSVGARPALVVAVLVQSAPLAGPLFASTDARGYDHYGRANPYGNWHTASVYGPLWSALSKGVDHIGETTFLFRLLATVSVLATVGLAFRLAARKALAVVVLGWNPLVALHFGGGGHNDAFMMALAVGGIALAAAGRSQLAGAAWAASLFVKWITGPLYVLWAIDRRRRGQAIGLIGALAAGIAIVALAYPLYGWTWIDAFNAYNGVNQVPASFGMLGWLTDLGLSTGHALTVSKALEGAGLALFALQAWRGKLRLGLAAGVLALLAPRLEAWYLLWCISLVSFDDRDGWGRFLAVVLTGVLLSDLITPILDA